VPETYVDDLQFEPNPKNDALHVNVSLDGDLVDGEVHATASFDGKPVGDVTAATSGRHAAFTLDIDETHYWSPEEPNLYDLSLQLVVDGETVDAIKSYFGLRSVTLGEQLRLSQR